MSFEFFLRLLGMLVLSVAGWKLGTSLAGGEVTGSDVMRGVLSLALAGAALGLLITPYLTLRPFVWVQRRIRQLPSNQLFAGTAGLALGLFLAALSTPPLSQLPGLMGQVLPTIVAIFLGYAGIQLFLLRERDLLGLLRAQFRREPGVRKHYVLLDTSAIIDGRIADIAQTGFIEGTLLVPRFVLNELQHIADARDPLRRNRGKRGLEILNTLQRDGVTNLEISDTDRPDIPAVDSKLVALARDLNAGVITTDYNLNKVAELQGVRVLNINELANAVKTVLLPGESFSVEIIQAGRERGQGVGYLDDGTMVVVEDAEHVIGQKQNVEVTRVLQTVAGRMIFAQILDASTTPNGQNAGEPE